MPFRSAYGCCTVCHRVVSVRAITLEMAVGSKPYRHKARRGPEKPWCDGAREPALHFTKSADTLKVEQVKQAQREMRLYLDRRWVEGL